MRHQLNDAVGGFGLVHAHRNRTRGGRARGMQHVQTRAITVVDLETEPRRALDHLHIVVDDGHIHVARHQRLAGNLAEAAKADQQHAAGQAVGLVHAVHVHRRLRRHALVDQHHQRGQRHRQHHHGGEVGIDVQVDHAGRCGGGEQHEGELAALRHQHATVQRLRVVAAHDARDHVDAQRLGRHQRQHQAEDQLPVRGHHAQVQRHAHAEEEQAEQDAAERFDVRFDLVAEGRLAQQHAGQDRAHRHRQAGQLHQQRRTQHHQQRGGGHPLACLRFGQHPEQRIEQEAADQHQADDGTHADRHRQPARPFAIRAARARRHPRHQRQQRHDQQVFEQQDRDDLLPRRQRDVTALGQQLHHHRGGGEHEAGGADEGDLPGEAEQLGDAGQHQRAGDDLQRAQPEDFLAQAPQVRGPHFQADHEQEHHHAELGAAK
ncbi:hypothetical protein G6F68_010511 [Rhizopus microsporus]|nr:hypothetical protein G6F68_010511 [Rhizopus microsporus]